MTDFIDIHSHHTGVADNAISIYNHDLTETDIQQEQPISIGLHPWNIKKYNIGNIQNDLNNYSLKHNVLAIGECGLDRAIDIPIETQTALFLQHCQAAVIAGKPLIIHCVRAYSDLIYLFKKNNYTEAFILHHYNGNAFQTEAFLKLNSYFSFGKQLMNPTPKFIDKFEQVPINRLFLETDDSEFSIQEIYLRAAELLQLSVETLKTLIFQNFNLLFNYGMAK